jgi:hypothetical protein
MMEGRQVQVSKSPEVISSPKVIATPDIITTTQVVPEIVNQIIEDVVM